MRDLPMLRDRNTWAVGLIVIVYVLLALGYGAVNPLFESPDEYLHYEFIRYLIERGELPVQTLGKLSEFHQPPLYYALTALVIGGIEAEPFAPMDNPFWGYEAYRFGVDNKARFIHTQAETFPYRGTFLAAHVARMVSIALGALSVLISYMILGEVFTRPAIAMGALAFVAFNPQFVFISSSISNDNLITLLSLLLAWLSICVVKFGLTYRRTLVIAVLIALAVLTKLSAAILVLVPLWVILRSHVTRRQRISQLLIVAATVGVMTGGWFLRNHQLYGDWTGIQTWQQIWGWQTGVTYWAEIGSVAHNIWTSYWGQFGLGQIVLPDWLYMALLLINLLSLIGLALHLIRRRNVWGPQSKLLVSIRRGPALILGLLLSAMIAASIWYGLANPTGAAGRFLLPAIVPIAALIFWGLRSLYRPDRPELDWWFAVVCYGTMVILSLAVLLGVIGPAYSPPEPTTLENVRAESVPTDIRFGDTVRLIGYTVDRNRLYPDEELQVTLCWHTLKATPTNVYFFLHLLGVNNAIVARRESLHGLGRYPSTQWMPDRVFCDNIPLRVEKDASGATVYDLEIGLVDLATGTRLPPLNEAGVELQPAILERIKVHAPKPHLPALAMQPMTIDFGAEIRLVGSEVAGVPIKAGGILPVTLIWQAVRIPTTNYTVFVHLRNAAGETVAQADGQPQAATYPTTFWDADEIIVDEHRLAIPDDLPADHYTVVIGLYRLDTGERLSIVQDGSGTEVVLPQAIQLR